MGFILSIIAYCLFGIVALVNFPVVMIKYVKKHGFFRVMNDYWFTNALELDIFGNYTYRTTWNVLFRKNNGYKFGRRGETISSVLGKNQRDKTLTIVGWIMVGILWVADIRWIKKSTRKNYIQSSGHCLMSIKEFDND
jgi:hypothetical protein